VHILQEVHFVYQWINTIYLYHHFNKLPFLFVKLTPVLNYTCCCCT